MSGISSYSPYRGPYLGLLTKPSGAVIIRAIFMKNYKKLLPTPIFLAMIFMLAHYMGEMTILFLFLWLGLFFTTYSDPL